MKLFGLRNKNTGLLLYVSVSPNQGRDCTDIRWTLSADWADLDIWLVSSRGIAEKAKKTNTEWYNATYDSPSNPFDLDDLEVVELICEIK